MKLSIFDYRFLALELNDAKSIYEDQMRLVINVNYKEKEVFYLILERNDVNNSSSLYHSLFNHNKR